MKKAVKHLIECHCVLPQYRDRDDIVYHHFIVFSELDDDDNVIIKHAQCNNCGVIHKIIDIGKSEVSAGRDASAAVVSISDIKISLPQNVVNVLESYNADLPTWEHVAWVFDNQQWGSTITLTSEEKSDNVEGKYMIISGPSSLKIEAFVRPVLFPAR